MHAELIAIGAELMLGEIADTNSAFLARGLRDLGVEVRWMSAVGDHVARIAALAQQAMARAPIVIATGGLGPTVDDPTREAVAQACGVELEYRPELWEQITARFARFRRQPTQNNRRQAYVPAGALPLENPVGTAPCFIVEHPGGVLIALPGVPREMEHMFTHAVVPYLRHRFGLTQILKARILRTVGIGESQVDAKVGDLEQLENPAVGLAAHAGQTDIRITARAGSEAEADRLIGEVEAQVRSRLGDFVYGADRQTVEEVVVRLLDAAGESVAVWEAGTGGLLAGRLAAAPGAASIFRGGQVALAEEAPANLADAAEQARIARGADWGLAASLHVGPPDEGGEIRLALCGGAEPEARSLGFGGPPGLGPTWASTNALNLLRLALLRRAA